MMTYCLFSKFLIGVLIIRARFVNAALSVAENYATSHRFLCEIAQILSVAFLATASSQFRVVGLMDDGSLVTGG
jgi:hypothetical protein